MSKNKVKVKIAGSSYVILSDESENYVLGIADELDKKIEEVKKSSSDISSLMASILVSMDLCDFKKKSISNIVSIENKNRDYANINKKLLEENSMLRDRISDLEMKINAMELKNKGK